MLVSFQELSAAELPHYQGHVHARILKELYKVKLQRCRQSLHHSVIASFYTPIPITAHRRIPHQDAVQPPFPGGTRRWGNSSKHNKLYEYSFNELDLAAGGHT